MAVKKGDWIDEAKNHEGESCAVLIEVLEGGAGLEKVICCGYELTDQDVVSDPKATGRAQGKAAPFIIDESKNNPNSCGLKIRVVDGGAGFDKVYCCGNELTPERDAV